MPVVATPTTTRLVSRDEIRRWLRDYPGGGGGVAVPGTGALNVLLEGVEFSDDDVDAGLQGAVDRYNCMTPVTALGTDTIPRFLLLYGAVAHLLGSEAWRQLRNQATVQAADVAPVGVHDKHGFYLKAADYLWGKFDEFCRQVKTQRNMEAFFGGFGSGYSNVSRTLYG